MNKMQMML